MSAKRLFTLYIRGDNKYIFVSFQAHKTDNKDMRVRLRDSENACETLKHRLLELSDFLEELLHQNEDGDVDCIDISPDRVSALKRKLNETRSMLEDLTFNLHGNEMFYLPLILLHIVRCLCSLFTRHSVVSRQILYE